MTPKFLVVHRFSPSFKLTGDPDDLNQLGAVMLNPRRVDYFEPMTPPTAQPKLYCGTRVSLGSKQMIVVQETCEEIRKMLSAKK